jgi:chromosome segregation ATPase
MAAVAARAAHGRMVLAEDLAADRFVTKQEAEAELLQAEEALEVSDRELAAAVAARTGATRGVEDLTSARARARAEVTARTKALKAVEVSLATATRSVKQLTSERSRLSNRLSDAESRLARSSIGPGLPGAPGAVAS